MNKVPVKLGQVTSVLSRSLSDVMGRQGYYARTPGDVTNILPDIRGCALFGKNRFQTGIARSWTRSLR